MGQRAPSTCASRRRVCASTIFTESKEYTKAQKNTKLFSLKVQVIFYVFVVLCTVLRSCFKDLGVERHVVLDLFDGKAERQLQKSLRHAERVFDVINFTPVVEIDFHGF